MSLKGGYLRRFIAILIAASVGASVSAAEKMAISGVKTARGGRWSHVQVGMILGRMPRLEVDGSANLTPKLPLRGFCGRDDTPSTLKQFETVFCVNQPDFLK